MLSTWVNFSLGFALIAAVSSLGLSLWNAARIAAHLKHPTTRKLASLEESIAELLEGFERLNARDKMRAVRAMKAPKAENAEPNPYTQPDEWKKFKRAQLGVNIAKGNSDG